MIRNTRKPCPFCGRPRPVTFWRTEPLSRSRMVGMVCRGCYASLSVHGPPRRGWRGLQQTCVAVWNTRPAVAPVTSGYRPCPLCASTEIVSFAGIERWPGYDAFVYDGTRCVHCGLVQRPRFDAAPADCLCPQTELEEWWNTRQTEYEWGILWQARYDLLNSHGGLLRPRDGESG